MSLSPERRRLTTDGWYRVTEKFRNSAHAVDRSIERSEHVAVVPPRRRFGWAWRVVFVRVNQVLVRLWTRRRSRCLTGTRRSFASGGGQRSDGRCASIGVQGRQVCVHARNVPRQALGIRWRVSGMIFFYPEASCPTPGNCVAGSCAWWDAHGREAMGVDIEQSKGIRWMPWHQEAMKDVARCEKPRGAASRR